MLVRRILTRPGALRFQLQRRSIIPSIPQQALPQPSTWLAKISFRADGKPRSKLIALGFGSLILLNLSLSYTIYNTIEHGEKMQKHLEKIIFMQRTLNAYNSVNFDDPMSTLSYFKELCRSFLPRSGEVDEMWDNMTLVFKELTEKGSKTSAEVRAHHILRSAVEKIHGAFRDSESNRDLIELSTPFDIALDAMAQALRSFSEILHEQPVELEDDSSNHFQLDGS